jgi:acetyl/propionyl-CoA carboxylase alpha subunit
MSGLRKLLVANRGEIACRVIRTARAMGLRTVAVFSDADARALHVAMADEAVRVGPAPPALSYLSIDALLHAARRTGAHAVHPGYGFLSENADFAQACVDAGLVFVGPPPEVMRAMGDKALAKRRMADAGVPCVPGFMDDADDARLAAEADRLGYPLLVKATAGGGGRGMRQVDAAAALPAALDAARREAQSAFGDGTLMLEQVVPRARHIEVQVFGDTQGRVVHLGERDCSVQRRRQKLIEESPAPTLTPAARDALRRDAVAAARAVGYVGAGTVEFVVGGDGRHWFIEMNTRLQVEHPVTECLTGIDLVEWQLRVAAGEPLPLAQDDIRFTGHAIEARLCAEDPARGFAPQTGRVLHWRPAPAHGVRIDAGIAEGDTVTPHYDPLLAKLIAHGRDRADAARRLAAALDATPLVGVATTGPFLARLLRDEAFASASIDTSTLDAWVRDGAPLLQAPPPSDTDWAVAAAWRLQHDRPRVRAASVATFDLALRSTGTTRTLRQGATVLARAPRTLRWQHDGAEGKALVVDDGPRLHLVRDGTVHTFEEPASVVPMPAAADASAVAPVAGTVGQVLVRAGDTVASGQPLASVEAMKMEMWLTAARDGIVRAVHAHPRDAVEAGTLIVELEAP